MPNAVTAPAYLTDFFSKELYTVMVGTEEYDSTKVYSSDANFTVSLKINYPEYPLALVFAAMQIGLAEVAAYKAENYMNKIKDNQEIQVACSNAINEAKKMTADTKPTEELVEYCDAVGVTIDESKSLSQTEIDNLVRDLELKQEAASSTLQTDMIYAEDCLGQYNAYLNGGSSNIDDLTNALQTIAQRI